MIDTIVVTFTSAPTVIFKKGYTTVPQTHLGDDVLFVCISNNSSKPVMQVAFTKDYGSPDAAYKLTDILYDDTNVYVAKHYTGYLAGSIQQTSTGAWSGTFAGSRDLFPGVEQVTQGVFTEAKP